MDAGTGSGRPFIRNQHSPTPRQPEIGLPMLPQRPVAHDKGPATKKAHLVPAFPPTPGT